MCLNFGGSALYRAMAVVLLVGLCSLLVRADVVVPVAGSVNLAGGTLDLACSDVIVGGTLDLAGGRLNNVRNVTVQTGGTIALGTGGLITLAGDWSNAGTLNAGTGSVNFVDAPTCAASSIISGSTIFYGLSVVSASGKRYRFASGSTQSVQYALVMLGTPSQPLQIESTTVGQYAYINLVGPTQTMDSLAVRDMNATGQWLALGLTNLAANGNTVRWFDFPVIPTLSAFSLVLLAFALAWCVFCSRSRVSRAVVEGK